MRDATAGHVVIKSMNPQSATVHRSALTIVRSPTRPTPSVRRARVAPSLRGIPSGPSTIDRAVRLPPRRLRIPSCWAASSSAGCHPAATAIVRAPIKAGKAVAKRVRRKGCILLLAREALLLRGVQPAEAVEIGRALVEAGFRILEVPMNSPQPLNSIALLSKAFGTPPSARSRVDSSPANTAARMISKRARAGIALPGMIVTGLIALVRQAGGRAESDCRADSG